MRKWRNTAIVSILWVLNLITGTGLDYTYHVTDYARIIILLSTIIILVFNNKSDYRMIRKNATLAFGGMFISFFLSSILHGKGFQAFDYLYVFFVVFLLSKLKLSEFDFRSIGVIFATLGFLILYIFERESILSGWNNNSIAMIGMFSYLVFLISQFEVKSVRSKVLIIFTALFVSYFLYLTNSRSCILFVTLALAFAFGIFKSHIVCRNAITARIILLAPLFIAIIVVAFSRTEVARRLDIWSLLHFRKPFFNGRDLFWEYGFRYLSERPLIGSGDLKGFNWHNSALHTLTAYGLIGYVFWLAAFNYYLDRTRSYLDDYLVQGSFVCFVIIYLQQAVELGIISTNPDLIPYIIIGMMLGRINYLRSEVSE